MELEITDKTGWYIVGIVITIFILIVIGNTKVILAIITAATLLFISIKRGIILGELNDIKIAKTIYLNWKARKKIRTVKLNRIDGKYAKNKPKKPIQIRW